MTHVDISIYEVEKGEVVHREYCIDCDYFMANQGGIFIDFGDAFGKIITVEWLWEELPRHIDFFAYAD